MSQTVFYLLAEPMSQTSAQQIQLICCQLAQQYYQQNQLVYIHCGDRQTAFAVDELLWQFDADSFVPHNLKGEGLQGGAPVEIGYDPLGANKPRQILINLAPQVPKFAVNFAHIIDFVPSDAQLKAEARERYKQYRAFGSQLTTQHWT